MVTKQFTFRGLTLEQLNELNMEEFSKLVNTRERRTLTRGLTKTQKKLIENIRRFKGKDKLVRTHCRDMVVLPEMVGAKLGIHSGGEFVVVEMQPEMIGHRLGEFSMTRKKVKHSAPGLGAARSSKFVPLK